jgi:hypothetical protein
MIQRGMRKKKKAREEIRKWHRYHFFGSATVAVQKDTIGIDVMVANISFSGIGVYSARPIGKGKNVSIKISFLDKTGKIQEDTITGKVDWQKKFKNMYLTGIIFDEEPSVAHQPRLVEHLTWLIDTYNLPQPYKDKRIAML